MSIKSTVKDCGPCVSQLKPSIETIFHALIPKKIVIHIHHLDSLCYLVRKSWIDDIEFVLNNKFNNYTFIDYYKPGSILGKAIFNKILKNKNLEIFFLRNHGIIIAGDTLQYCEKLLKDLIKIFKINFKKLSFDKKEYSLRNFKLLNNKYINDLILNKNKIKFLKNSWSLYPDHIVFLGSKCNIIKKYNPKKNYNFSLLFVENKGVFKSKDFTFLEEIMLKLYSFIIEFNINKDLNSLNKMQIDEIVNWDAEHYRINLSK